MSAELDDQQLTLRKAAPKDAVASVRIENLEPSHEVLSDLDSWVAGKIEFARGWGSSLRAICSRRYHTRFVLALLARLAVVDDHGKT